MVVRNGLTVFRCWVITSATCVTFLSFDLSSIIVSLMPRWNLHLGWDEGRQSYPSNSCVRSSDFLKFYSFLLQNSNFKFALKVWNGILLTLSEKIVVHGAIHYCMFFVNVNVTLSSKVIYFHVQKVWFVFIDDFDFFDYSDFE